MQAFGLSLIKGRLGSDQERREIQTSPERNALEAPVFGAPRRSKTSNAAAAAIDAHEELSHADDDTVFAVANARRASTDRQRASKKGAADGHPRGPSISPGDGRR
jgi:hypothetical protein